MQRGRLSHRTRLNRASAQAVLPKGDTTNLVDFLGVAQQYKLSFLPVKPQGGLGALGRGLSGLVMQSTADALTTLAFKPYIPSDTDDENIISRAFDSLITEIRILQHEPIRESRHIIDIVGISWHISGKKARPVLVTQKANEGELGDFLFRKTGSEPPDLTSKMQIFIGIAESIELLHNAGRFYVREGNSVDTLVKSNIRGGARRYQV